MTAVLEAPADTRPALSGTQTKIVFGTVMLGMLLSALDQTIVSTALPTIVGDLGGSGHMSWVVTAYILAETIATVLAGKFGDLFGRKTVFQASVVVFVVGSFFCGLAHDLTFLIVSRAVQGIGAGGLLVTATALIGDVIPLRDRARYQGAMGAVFGITTVIGPLLGGLFTDHLSWRWAFYVNVPLAVVVLVLAARTIPGLGRGSGRSIDYLGVLFVALGASGLTLATSWGGVEYAWGSAVIIGLFVGSVVALAIFVAVELRAEEPILPMRLFRSRVFSVASVLSFIVGFAMLGSLTFLPIYLQFVEGASATMSGLRTLPMVLGLLVCAVGAGQVVGATGIYRPFPIAGAAVTGLGLYLLATLDETSSFWRQSVSMLVLGAGIGLAMQVLTVVVQNTADYRDLGAATSGVTFFRTLGSSFGASVMGTIYANQLAGALPRALAEAGVAPSAVATPEAVHALPAAAQAPIVAAYADTVHHVFLWVVPVAVVAFLFALALPQVALRGTARETARGAGEGFGMPVDATSDEQLDEVIGRLVRQHPEARREVVSGASVHLEPAVAWGILSVHLRTVVHGRPVRQADIEDGLHVPHGVLTSFYDDLGSMGYVTRGVDHLRLTATGDRAVTALDQAWTDWLLAHLGDWVGDVDRDEFGERARAVIRRAAQRTMAEDQDQLQPV